MSKSISPVTHHTFVLVVASKISQCFTYFYLTASLVSWASLVVQMVKNLPTMWETHVQSLGKKDPLEKGMATHSSILACRIPWTEEPGGLQPMRWQRVRHDWSDLAVYKLGFPSGSVAKNLTSIQELQKTRVWSLGQEDPLEEGIATHSSILAWRIPWTEEPGGLQPMGSQRVGHDWSDSSCSSVQTQGWSSPPLLSVCLFYRSPDLWGILLCSVPYLYIPNNIVLKAWCLSLRPKRSLPGKTWITDLKYVPILHWSCDLSMVFDRPGLVPKSTS